jgi:hypothetical protein
VVNIPNLCRDPRRFNIGATDATPNVSSAFGSRNGLIGRGELHDMPILGKPFEIDTRHKVAVNVSDMRPEDASHSCNHAPPDAEWLR